MGAGTIWLTGLPCSGKTTLAKGFVSAIRERGAPVIHLDGDEVRNGLCAGLGFTRDGRHENLSRIAHVCSMVNRAGIMAVASFVTPLKEFRYMVRGIVPDVSFVYVKCSQRGCEARDVKGMWAKARRGDIIGFTGLDSDYEQPESPGLVVDTEKVSVNQGISMLVDMYRGEYTLE